MARQNAEENFRDAVRDVRALLDLVGQEVNVRVSEAEAAGPDWAWAGSARHWRERLIELLVTLTGAGDETEGRAMIEETLADIKAMDGKENA